ncbi:hypothetical protein BSKO_11929 [Bryopsis sp. KO-2023]|nr:hypothetical protein BSKO_11929 [Bryopsis sp. KO-2023]
MGENNARSIRDRCTFLFMHAGVGRGDDQRNIQLCDLLMQEVEGVGPDVGSALVSVMRQGKTKYDTYLIFGSAPNKPLTYNQMNNSFNKAFKANSIAISKSTHAPRGSAARALEGQG